MKEKNTPTYTGNKNAILAIKDLDIVSDQFAEKHVLVIDAETYKLPESDRKIHKAVFKGFKNDGRFKVTYRPGHLSVVDISQILTYIDGWCGTPPHKLPKEIHELLLAERRRRAKRNPILDPKVKLGQRYGVPTIFNKPSLELKPKVASYTKAQINKHRRIKNMQREIQI